MKKVCATCFILFATIALSAGQPSQLVLDYIDKYKEIAVAEMIAYKIPASITLAQGIIESGAGQSELAKKSNNHFGIKCHTDWKGEKVYYDDDAKDECFRKYDHVEDSYRDHSEFLSGKTRYASLFELKADDYKGWAKGLKAAGYATNPKYADMLINLIEEYDLHALDKLSVADVKKMQKEEEKRKQEKEEIKKEEPVVKKETQKESKKDKNFNWGGYQADVFYFNRIPTVTVKDGDSPENLAEKHHKKLSLLRDYNDIENGADITPGTKFYLQPKRKKGDTKYHEVKSGETIWSISRDEGVRMEQLYKFNKLKPGQEPAAGQKIYLRNKCKDAPQLQTAADKKKEIKKSVPKEIKKEVKVEEKVLEEKTPEQKKTEFKDDDNDDYIDFDDELVAPEINNKAPGAEGEKIITLEPIIEVIKQAPTEFKQVAVKHTVEAKETLYALSKTYGVSVAQIQEWNGLKDNNISIGQELIVGYK